MKKTILITLTALLLLILGLLGLLFTQQGNDILKPYLKAELEKQVDQPVNISHFKLRYDHTELKIVINKALNIDVQSVFNLLGLNFDGTYTIYVNNFHYDGINFRQANINGEFKGVPDDIYVNGKGNTFDAPLNYYLRILEGDAKELTFQFKDMNIADLLALSKQPAIAQGIVDANVTIPTLSDGELNAHGLINLDSITFNDALIKEHYEVTMPEALMLDAVIDANMTDDAIIGDADIKSTIADVTLTDLHFHKDTKHITSKYIVDFMNLNVLSLSNLIQTKLHGALLLKGEIEKQEQLKITGQTKSLGGEIDYLLIDKDLNATIESVPVRNILHMFRLPAVVNAHGTGELNYNTSSKKGHSKLALGKFKLASSHMTKTMGKMMLKDPSSITFGDTLFEADIDGDDIYYRLIAKSHHATFTVEEGSLNHKKDSHEAKMAFGYDKYAVEGHVGGSIRHPHIGFDTKGLIPAKMADIDFMKKVEREIKRLLERLDLK